MRSLLPLLLLTLASPARAQTTSTAPVVPALRLLAEAELPDFTDSFSSKSGLVKAAKKTLAYLEKAAANPTGPKYFKIADRDYSTGVLIESINELLEVVKASSTAGGINEQVKRRFDVFQSAGLDGAGRVVFSSYYQPMLPASRVKTAKYLYPLYRRPADMVEVDLGSFDAKKYGAESLIGRLDKKSNRVVPYFTRGDIDVRKKLAGKGLELVWLKDKFDNLDLHIQGSGILKFPNGKEMLVKYAGTNAHPYNSVGLTLVRAGIFAQGELTRDKLRDYLRAHPEGDDWILASNPRFTFFDLAPLPPDGEPFGTINESLVPSRSIAIDPAVIPLGAVAFFSTTSPQADKEGRLLGQFPNSRFALCMDTGGAIKGPGRVDIYVGHGKQADTTARNQWNDGKLYILIKKVPPRER